MLMVAGSGIDLFLQQSMSELSYHYQFAWVGIYFSCFFSFLGCFLGDFFLFCWRRSFFLAFDWDIAARFILQAIGNFWFLFSSIFSYFATFAIVAWRSWTAAGRLGASMIGLFIFNKP